MEQLRALARQYVEASLLVSSKRGPVKGGTCRLSCPYSPSYRVEDFSETPSAGCRAFSKSSSGKFAEIRLSRECAWTGPYWVRYRSRQGEAPMANGQYPLLPGRRKVGLWRARR